jgi:hypothetical protein
MVEIDRRGVEITETYHSYYSINTIGLIYIHYYLKRKGKLLPYCVFDKFHKEGLESLDDLILELQVTKEIKRDKSYSNSLNPSLNQTS